MNDDMKEIKEFWDEFADEYTQIQAESQIALVEDVAGTLLQEQLLPCKSLLDLAGGSGKFIAGLISHVKNYTLLDISTKMLSLAKKKYSNDNLTLLHQAQQSFFKECPTNCYDIVFSAMNPALDSPLQLSESLRIAKDKLCVLQMVEKKDNLFTSLEKEPLQGDWMEQYKKWLNSPYTSYLFCYQTQEEISLTFFHDYFYNDLPEKVLEEKIKKFFQEKKSVLNYTSYCFELLIIDAK